MKITYLLLSLDNFGGSLREIIKNYGEDEPDINNYIYMLVTELIFLGHDHELRRKEISVVLMSGNLSYIEPMRAYGIMECLIELEAYRLPTAFLIDLLQNIVNDIYVFIRDYCGFDFKIERLFSVGRKQTCLVLTRL